MAAIGFSFQYQRLNPAPLDVSDVFDSLADFQAYLAGGTAYAGQICAVRNGTNDPDVYKVLEDRTHAPLGGAVTDAQIGARSLTDAAGSSTLVSVTAKQLTPWLQGIRNNLKYVLSIGGGGITGFSSRLLPMVYRCPVASPVGTNVKILGAVNHPMGFGPYYVTDHGALGLNERGTLVRADSATLGNPKMTSSNFYPHLPESIPYNLGLRGYKGSWSRRIQTKVDAPSGSGESYLWETYAGDTYRIEDRDMLIFNEWPSAVWATSYGKIGEYKPHVWERVSWDNFEGNIASMWANTEHIYVVTSVGDLHHWYIRPTRRLGSEWPEPQPGLGSRIDGQSFYPPIEAPALPTFPTRVYVDPTEHRVLVWGTNPPNRLAYYYGYYHHYGWVALTLPFNINGAPNAAITLPGHRIGVYNPSNGYYYTCDNPLSGASATWTFRYGVGANRLMTKGFNPAFPQFVPRGTSSASVLAESYEGVVDYNCYGIPALAGNNAYFSWPNELLCNHNRWDIIPSTVAAEGYAYAYGSRQTRMSIFGDKNTFNAVTSVSGLYLDLLPFGTRVALPGSSSLSSNRSEHTLRDEINRRLFTVSVANP